MRSKLLNDSGERVYAVVFQTGEEVIGGLTRFAEEHNITAGRFSAIGALSTLELGYFDWPSKQYKKISLDQQVEVLTLIGHIVLEHERPTLHAHIVVGNSDGAAFGGHLMSAQVRPTLEVIVEQSPSYLVRRRDPVSGLGLIAIGQE